MHSCIASDEGCKPTAFLAPVPVHRVLRKSLHFITSSQTRIHADTPAPVPRRAASLPSSQECDRVAPSATVTSVSSVCEEVPVILLVDHGSRRATANDMLADVGAMVQRKTDLPVYTAHMELASPTIDEGVDICVKEGATRIIVVPFFLSPGRHATTDIPQMTAKAVTNHPGVTYEVRPPIGTHPGIIDVILDRAGLLDEIQN